MKNSDLLEFITLFNQWKQHRRNTELNKRSDIEDLARISFSWANNIIERDAA